MEYDLGLVQPNELFLPQVSFGNGVITAAENKPEHEGILLFLQIHSRSSTPHSDL